MRQVYLGNIQVSVVCTVLWFCDYSDVYCCKVAVYFLFCNGVWVCADIVYLVLLSVACFLRMKLCCVL